MTSHPRRTVPDMLGHKRWRDDRNAWELVVPLPRHPLTGRRRDRSRLFRGTAREADRALAELVAATSHERVSEEATVDQTITRWLELVATDLSPTTLREYRRLHVVRIRPALGDLDIRDLGPEQLDRFYRGLVNGGLSPSSVHRIHAVIRRALAQAVKWGWLPSNPAARATLPVARRKVPVLPSPEVVLQLIDDAVAGDPDFGALVRTAAVTGARRGEVCGLRWSALDLDQAVVVIDTAVVDVAGHLHVKDPKWHSVRRVSIDPDTVALLTEHRARIDARAAAGAATLRADAFVWSLDLDGARPIRPEVVTARWRAICREAGVQCRFHDLRHFSASHLIAAGVDVRTVAGRLGHANPSTTLGIYAHAFAARDQAAATAIADVLRREAS